MKKDKMIYWIVTGIFSLFMLTSAIPDILMVPDAMTFMNHLGYPDYFVPFIGVAKTLGAAAILIPGFPRIKEWAYAGLIFDLIGAMYSTIAVGEAMGGVIFILAVIALGFTSYYYHHKLLKLRGAGEVRMA